VEAEVSLMDYFYGGGGNNKPFFIYRFRVKTISNEMYTWCENYPSKGSFSRWHIIYNGEKELYLPEPEKPGDVTNIIQFELKDAYLAFQYAFAGEIMQDLTWENYR